MYKRQDIYNRGYRKCKKVIKGVWGMPRLLEATKDVVSCDKPREMCIRDSFEPEFVRVVVCEGI